MAWSDGNRVVGGVGGYIHWIVGSDEMDYDCVDEEVEGARAETDEGDLLSSHYRHHEHVRST